MLLKNKLANKHWQKDYLEEILPQLVELEKAKSPHSQDEKIVESIGTRLRRKFSDLSEVYSLQAQVATEYKEQLNRDSDLRKRVDKMFRREIQKLMGDERDV